MALKPGLLLLLWGLTLYVHGVTSCNVTCTTDYRVSLNCSCSGSVPTYSGLLTVTCSYYEELSVNGSCEVKPPQSWCVMYPERRLEEVAFVETMCTATASRQGDQGNASVSPEWALCDVVKPSPPVNVRVTNTDDFYNVTWDHGNRADCLTYRVRVRDNTDSKDPALSLDVTEKHALLDHTNLQPHVLYTVDVQAKMCPENPYLGPWSEWSSTAHWRIRGTYEGINGLWWYVTLSVILVLVLLLLGYFKKPWWQQKLQRILYIPKAEEFFKPLDLIYGGNFKEWVKPVFSEYDYLMVNSHAQMTSEKQHDDVLQWNNEKQRYGEANGTKQGGQFLHALQPHSDSPLFFQDGGSSQGTGHSTGHVSIHTVTLSGEEEFGEEVASQSSVNTLRSYQEGERFGPFEEDNREHAGYDLEGALPQRENQILNNLSMENINFQPHAQHNEPERVSLVSFSSNEQSEDGYPHVDLDTIDSGFGECGSPRASDSNAAEQTHSDLFHEHKSLNSNYVKQWMICSTIEDDFSNSETELHEAP